MRYFTNEYLRTKLYPEWSPPENSRYSLDSLYSFHEEAESADLERWGKLSLSIAKAHAEMVGCQNSERAESFHDEVMEYIRKHAKSREEWRAVMKASAEHLEELRRISASYCTKRWCHAPNAEDYRCFCNEK